MTVTSYDYIIVGAGSAGCVLANRLSEDGTYSVLLLEAGGSDKHILVQMPTALSYPMSMARFNWGYNSQAEEGLGGRNITCPRGKGLGGSSSINGMVYVRGNACDFDEWKTQGAAGWSYKECLPYFKRSETWQDGEDEYRGGQGPLGVTGGNNMRGNPLYQAFIAAGVEAGYPQTDDYNGHQQEGFGPMHMTVRGGVRDSTARAYLKPAMIRSNLTVKQHALVSRVIFKDQKAVGVEAEIKGVSTTLMANKEIILSAGAIASPNILERSGIGDKAFLESKNIKPVYHLPGVGENLQDHLEVYFQFHCKEPVSLNNKLGVFQKILIGLRWILFKTGLGATNHFESCAFIRSDAGVKSPDIQYHFLPGAIRYDGTPSVKGHGFQVHVGPNKPKSRGGVHIVSSEPDAEPKIKFNYLQDKRDIQVWRKCIRLTREIMDQPAMDMYRGGEIQPGEDVQNDEAIDAWVRENVESAYHPSGSCKMGAADDPRAVVDVHCRVIGVENLRVVDASIFPTLPNGNINAPTIMVAEKAADIILAKPPLKASDLTPWIDPEWKTRQRERAPLRS